MGRSIAQFHLAGITQASVLMSAQGFAAQEGLQIIDGSPNHVTLATGSELWTGERRVRVGAWDAPGGVNMIVEAWAIMFLWGEYSAKPTALWGFFARRHTWRLVSRFLARLGVTDPERSFRHD